MNYRDHLTEMWHALDDERRLDLMDRYFSDDYVRHSEEGDMSRDEFRDALETLHTGFPNLKAQILDVLGEGSRVAYRWIAVGTHEGAYLGAPATHRNVEASGITIANFGSGGRIEEEWASWNKVSVLHALGIIPIG